MIKLFLVWMLNHTKPFQYTTDHRLMHVLEFKQQSSFERLVTVLQSMGVQASIVRRS